LDHKLHDGKKSKGRYCYWDLPRFPTRIEEAIVEENAKYVSYEGVRARASVPPIYDFEDLLLPCKVRLYFAVKGRVIGYFLCKAVDEDRTQLRFFSEDFVKLPSPQPKIRPSQGWRYFLHSEVKDTDH